MKKECTEQDLRELARSAQAVFEAVTLTEAPRCDGWQDDGLRVDYELRNGRVDCVLHRRVEADGKCWELEMCAPLAGNVLPEERMTPRERELCREDMSHDFLTGVYNRRYLETVFAQKLEQCAAQGQSAMAKLNTKMGISMKTLTDKSTRNLAEMLTQGSGMGVVDCVKAQKDYPNAAPGAKRLAQRLQEFQEDSRVKLEQFL